MAITIPTVAAGRVLFANQADASGTRTFPSLTGLTKNSGDTLLAIAIGHQSAGTSGAVYSTWGASFTELTAGGDQMTTSGSTMCVGIASKISTGSETGTFTVTQASPTGHATLILLSIAGAHDSTPPEAGTIANGTAAAADPGSFNPAGWDAEETLWIALGMSGMTAAGGTWTGVTSGPASYSDFAVSGTVDASTVGQTEGGVAFRLLNAASEDVGTFSVDVSNARNSALVIAVRPALENPDGTGAITVPSATVSGTGELILTGTGAISVPSATVAGTGEEVFTATGAITVPSATVAGTGAEEFTATGAIAVPAATVAGTGDHTEGAPENPTGTGSISVPAATVSGTGALIITGTGAIEVPAAVVAGTGSLILTGTGAILVPAATVDGAGIVANPITGTGAISVPAAVVAGSGLMGVTDVAAIAVLEIELPVDAIGANQARYGELIDEEGGPSATMTITSG